MADAAVSFLLNKLTELLQEAHLLTDFQADIQYISDELEFMKAFLPVADAKKDGDPMLNVWVRQVREVAHDMEDALDDFRLRIEPDNGRGFSASLQNISCFFKNLQARRQVASRIKDIKSRVISISEGHRRYCIKNKLSEESSRSSNATRLDCQGDALLLEEADLVGIEKPRCQLIGVLVGGKSEREVVSVVGMGGLGKTTLVKKVYDDADVKKHFKFRVWVTVSQSCKTQDLLKDIIHQLFRPLKKPVPQEVERMNKDQLKVRIKKFLQQKRYLIVLDDVWRIDTWDAVKHAFPNNNCGSRVLLTTRNNEVASTSCVDSPNNIYPLHPLSVEESWTLFCKKIFHRESCPPHLKDVSESILRRCEGLPLAIVAISGVLATKEKSRIDAWEMIHRSLGSELGDNDKLKNMTKILSLSYDDLPYYLKSCLLYFSIFPDDHPIAFMRLIRLWIAEGFVKAKDGKTLEEVAEGYLSELLSRSLIQAAETTSDGRVKTCRIHDLLREIILLKSKDQNFVAIAKEKDMMWPEKVRRLSVHNHLTTTAQRRHIGSRLRSLLIFRGIDSSTELSGFKIPSRSLRLLTVLDLEGSPLQEFPNQVVNLVLLKYLSLKNTKVSRIPRSIGKLQHLETLDLKHSRVTELPVEILKLQKLRHLLVYLYINESDDGIATKFGFKAPMLIGCLQSLQKLCFIIANLGGGPLMKELGKLRQLRRLGIVKLRKEDGKALCSSIENLSHLRALSVTSTEASEIIDLQHLHSPPQFLQRVYLTGYLEKLPDWITCLHGLEKIVLKWSRLSVDPLPSLQHLPNLVHLEFVQVFEGETLCFRAEGFQKLKFLGLNKLDRLKSITMEKGAMPCLENLIVQCCKSLQKVPSGIEHLTKLKLLQLVDMPNEMIDALRPDGDGEDYQKVAHVLEVYCTYQKNGMWDVFSVESFKEGENSAWLDVSNRKREQYIWK